MGVSFVFAAAGFVAGAYLSIISYQVGLVDYREHRVEKWQISMAHWDDADGDTGKNNQIAPSASDDNNFRLNVDRPHLGCWQYFFPHRTQIYTHRSIKLDVDFFFIL